jgi:hypothetical protein
MTVIAMLAWWRTRRQRAANSERARAEALVEVERRGMMGGRAPELRLTPVIRPPRFRPVEPLAIEHEDGS